MYRCLVDTPLGRIWCSSFRWYCYDNLVELTFDLSISTCNSRYYGYMNFLHSDSIICIIYVILSSWLGMCFQYIYC